MDDALDSPRRLAWEKQCVGRARQGDVAAFGALYDEYARPLYARVLMPRLADRVAAEDVLAETFCTALEQIGRYETRERSIWFWLARIAVNKATDAHRARARGGRALARFEDLLGPLWAREDRGMQAVEHQRDLERLRGRVQVVLDRLNPRYRKAVQLRFFEDLGRDACAEALAVRLGTFDVLLLRALRAFRREWERALAAENAEE